MVKKRLGIVIIVLIIIGVCTGFYVRYKYNEKPDNDVEHASAKDVITITATDLTKDYTADETKANAKYLDKVIVVSGIVAEVANNQEGSTVLTLDTGDPMAGVQCTMREKGVKATKGQNVAIKGFCKGNNMGVILNDCVLK